MRKTLKNLANPDTLGGRISLLMLKKNIRVNEMAERIGLSGQGLRDILSGKSQRPKSDALSILSRELGVSVDWLLNGEPTMAFEPPLAYGAEAGSPGAAIKLVPVSYISLARVRDFVEHNGDTAAMGGVPKFFLPAPVLDSDRLIAFEADGQSGDARLQIGTVVICTTEAVALDRVRSGHYYVLLHAGELVIARLNNRMHSDNLVEIMPTLEGFSPVPVQAKDVVAIHKVALFLQRA